MSRFFPWLYDLVMGAAERSRLATWRRGLVRPATGRIVEIAAGTGLDFAHYLPNATVIATEPDLGMLTRARERAGSAPATILLVAADAQALPFRDGTFDTAVVGLALCTIPSPPLALAELRRVLRPGGMARLLEHVRIDRPIIGWLQDALTPLWRRVAGGCRLNEQSLESVQNAGFQVDDLHSYLMGCVVAIEASVQPVIASLTRSPDIHRGAPPTSDRARTHNGLWAPQGVKPFPTYPRNPEGKHASRNRRSQ